MPGAQNPLALQLYTLREELAADREAVLRRGADSGYGAVEPYDILTDPAGLHADLDEAGLAACAEHLQDRPALEVLAGQLGPEVSPALARYSTRALLPVRSGAIFGPRPSGSNTTNRTSSDGPRDPTVTRAVSRQ